MEMLKSNNQNESQKPALNELIETVGSKKLAMFVVTWLKNNRNATKAYLQLHPNVTYESARVLGSRLLTRVNIGDILALYNLGLDKYIKQLKEGLEAQEWNKSTKSMEPDHRTRLPYHNTLGRLLGLGGGQSYFNTNQFQFRVYKR